jgi:ABC-2 type transport system permease protein
VAISGTFDSAFQKKDGGAAGAADKAADTGERLLERSTPDARLVVVGSSSFVSDAGLGLSSQGNSRQVANNLELVQNIIDWAAADTDLLAIRARGSVVRTLDDVSEDQRPWWEYGNYGIALAGLGLVVAIARIRRRLRTEAASRIIVPTAHSASDKNSKEAAA